MSDVIGYYVTSDDAQCADCHEPEEWGGFEDWDEPVPIFYGTAGDTPTHCGDCGLLIPHALTWEGYAYVADRLARRDGRPDVLDKWASTYGPDLDALVQIEPDDGKARGLLGRLRRGRDTPGVEDLGL
jgi:hypothetical protein